jgi:hypothetical protein
MTKRRNEIIVRTGPEPTPFWRVVQLAENYWRVFFAGPLGIQAWNEGWSSALRDYVMQAALRQIRAGELPNVSIPTLEIERWRRWFVMASERGAFAVGAIVDGQGNPKPGCEQGVRPWPNDYENWCAAPDAWRRDHPRNQLGDAGRAMLRQTIAALGAKGKISRRGPNELWPDEPTAITAASAFEEWRDDPKRQSGATP